MGQRNFQYKDGVVSIVNGKVSDYLFENKNRLDAFVFPSRFNMLVESDSLQQDLIFDGNWTIRTINSYGLLSKQIPEELDNFQKKILELNRKQLKQQGVDLDSADFIPTIIADNQMFKIKLMYVNFLLPKSPNWQITSYVTMSALEKCWSIPTFARSVVFPLIGYIPIGKEVEKYFDIMLDEFKGHLDGEVRTLAKTRVLEGKSPLERLVLVLYDKQLCGLAVERAKKIFS